MRFDCVDGCKNVADVSSVGVVATNDDCGHNTVFCPVVTLVVDDENGILVEGFVEVVVIVDDDVLAVVDNIVDIDSVVVDGVVVGGGAPHLLMLSQSHVDGHNSKQFTSIDVFEYN